MNCTYTIPGIEGLGSMTYENLYAYLLENIQHLDTKNISDIVFSDGDDSKITVDLIKKHTSHAKLRKRNYNKSSSIDEVFDSPEDSKYVDLHNLIETGKRANNLPYVTLYNQDELRLHKIKEHMDKGLTDLEALTEADKELSKYEAVENIAYDIHTAINSYFRGNYTEEALRTELASISPSNPLYTPEFVNQLVAGLKQTRDNIYNTLDTGEDGKSLKFISNVALESKINGSDKLLYSNIDLIVVDAKGVPHIYLFKTSSTVNSLQPTVKTDKRDYYLAFNRQLLASLGIDVSKTSLNIVPMHVMLDDSNKLRTLTFEPPQDRSIVLKSSGINNLTYGTGKMWSDANSIIPVNLHSLKIDNDISDKVSTNLSKMFPTKNLSDILAGVNAKEFIRRYVRTSSNPDYAYEFTDINENVVYIKENSPKEENEELRDKVLKELIAREATSNSSLQRIIKVIKDAVANKKPLTKILSTSEAIGNILISMGKYTEGTWIVPEGLEYLEMMGIMVFLDTSTGLIELVALTSPRHLSLNNEYETLGQGKTILGAFKRDDQVGDNILLATNGNILLMKIMCALNELVDNSNILASTIGDLKVLNINTGETTVAQPKLIINAFESLCEETKINNRINRLRWANEIEILKNRLTSILLSGIAGEPGILPSMFSELETLDPFRKDACIKSLDKMISEMEATYRIVPDFNQARNNANTPQAEALLSLYILMHQTRAYLSGAFHLVKALSVFGSIKKRDLLQGQSTTTPDTVPDLNILDMTKTVRQSYGLMRDRFNTFVDSIRADALNAYYKSKGYNQALNMIIGNLATVFRNLFREKDGKINPQMLFKDPDNMSENLTSEERVFLRKILWAINKRRFNLVSETSQEAIKAKQSIKWFWVPLTEAATASKISSDYIQEKIKEESKNIMSSIKRTKKRFTEKEEGLYSEAEEVTADSVNQLYQVFNHFSYSEADEDTRLSLLNSQDTSFWETNVENILWKFELAHIRKEILDNVLPAVRSVRILTQVFGQMMNLDVSKNLQYLDNYLKLAVYGRTLYSKDEKALVGYIKKSRALTSFLMISGNIVAPIRETIMGMWNAATLLTSDIWKELRGFDKKDFIKAFQIVFKDSWKTIGGITMLEALNLRFGIANVDVNVLAQKAQSGRHGLFNLRHKLYWTATAGDYLNRMTLFVARMIHDGCLDACSYDDKGFTYNWKKDTRFKHLASGIKGPEYNKERGLYLSLIRDFNDSGYNLLETDDLPAPYAPNEVIVMKNLADKLYGYYDSDIRIQLEGTALGAIVLLFSTFLTAMKTTWMMPGKYYDTVEKVRKKDENGNLLYWKEELQSDGSVKYIPTTEDTGMPIMEQGKTYMEGVFYTLYNFYKDFQKEGFSGAFKHVSETDAKKLNLKLLGCHLALWFILGQGIKFLLEIWDEERKADKTPYTASRAVEDGLFNIVQRAINGSFSSFNIIDAFGGNILTSEPPMVGMVTKMYTSTWRTVFGEGDLNYWLKSNVASYRAISGFSEGLSKIE